MKSKPLILGIGLGMILGTGALLVRLSADQHVGSPGVRVGPDLDSPVQAMAQCVQLPTVLSGYQSRPEAVTPVELANLPRDTTYGRRVYRAPDGSETLISVVLMGRDRTSIHQPQYCLVGQGWRIDRTEDVILPMERPASYKLPVKKLTASIQLKKPDGQPVTVHGIYAYWFVCDKRVTANGVQRMFWMAKDLVQHRNLQRWAYIAYFSTCQPGREEETFERMKKLIISATPEFQTFSPASAPSHLARARN